LWSHSATKLTPWLRAYLSQAEVRTSETLWTATAAVEDQVQLLRAENEALRRELSKVQGVPPDEVRQTDGRTALQPGYGKRPAPQHHRCASRCILCRPLSVGEGLCTG
jgi:hypothetical protein